MSKIGSSFKLMERVIALSEANTWDEAVLEWQLDYSMFVDEPEKCLCGHYPIKEIFVLVNTKNESMPIQVGNSCIEKLDPNQAAVTRNVKRVAKDITKSFKPHIVHFARMEGWIDEWSRNFYVDTWRKRKLSDKQAQHRQRINKVILAKCFADVR